MFAAENTVEYLNVYSSTLPDPVVSTSLVIVAAAGFVIMMGQLIFDGSVRSILFGTFTFVLAMGAVVPLQTAARDNISTIKQNMATNIETKYGATWEMPDLTESSIETVSGLDKPKKYKLVFENGATAEYELYFNENSEPVVNEAPADSPMA